MTHKLVKRTNAAGSLHCNRAQTSCTYTYQHTRSHSPLSLLLFSSMVICSASSDRDSSMVWLPRSVSDKRLLNRFIFSMGLWGSGGLGVKKKNNKLKIKKKKKAFIIKKGYDIWEIAALKFDLGNENGITFKACNFNCARVICFGKLLWDAHTSDFKNGSRDGCKKKKKKTSLITKRLLIKHSRAADFSDSRHLCILIKHTYTREASEM